MGPTLRTLCLGLAVLLVASPTMAQVPPAPTPTLWSFLGIPQAFGKVNAQLFNRRGNLPGLESKPPLKRLADPRNLAEDMPAPVKAAAKIKQAEDLAPQKKKAIKYLASVGCGCYDKGGEVTDALVAAMGDCTESVRMEAVQAIMTAASEDPCCGCGSKCCCNEKILKKLAELAYERGTDGCFVELSERVRQEAVQALNVCCTSQEPVEIIPEEGKKEPGYETVPKSSTPGDDVPPPPSDENPTTANSDNVPFSLSAYINTGEQPVPGTAAQPAPVSPAPSQLSQDRIAAGGAPVIPKRGHVTRVDTLDGTARVKFDAMGEVPERTKVKAYHEFLFSTSELGEYLVIAMHEGEAVIRKSDGGSLGKLSRGDAIIVK